MATQDKNLAAVLLSPQTDLVVQERPIPTPGPGELLVKTKAVGLNPIDWKRQAWNFLIPSYPVILGTGMRLHLPYLIYLPTIPSQTLT